MKKLSLRSQELISRGLNTCGKSMDAYHYVEEELYINEADEIYNFLEWLFKIDRPYGPANAQERWAEFQRGDKPPAEYFDLITEFSCDSFGNAKSSYRMAEATLEHVGLIMFQKNKDLNWKFTIVNQDEEVVQEFTKEEVLAEMGKLDANWKAMESPQKMEFYSKRKSYGYRP